MIFLFCIKNAQAYSKKGQNLYYVEITYVNVQTFF